jgi:hypothetical protein
MQTKEKKTAKGILKYRMPNIAEGYYYLSLCDQVKTGADVMRIRGKFISNMKDLLDFSSLGYSSYDEVLSDKDSMYVALSEIAEEIYQDIMDCLAKKNSSPTL